MLQRQLAGGYSFLPGIAPYSCGVKSDAGFEIVHVTFQSPRAYRDAFEAIGNFLEAQQRPKAALCGIELRSPSPYSFAGFSAFNQDYAQILESWGLFIGGVNPVARTNVAPVHSPPSEPVIYGFSFTRPCDTGQTPSFVVAGAGELPEGVLSRDGIIALGDASPHGIETKARFVMDLMETRLCGLGVEWPSVTGVNIYTAHSLTPLLPQIILPRLGSASIRGVHWFYSRPPVCEIEYEMDLRGVRTEIYVA